MAEERAAVHAGDEALDDVLGPQVKPGDLGDGLGMQKTAGIVGRLGCHRYGSSIAEEVESELASA